MRERIGVVETKLESTACDRQRYNEEFARINKVITDGMQLRIILQGDVANIKQQLDRIEKSLNKHMDEQTYGK
jgi:hypothetical protein